MENNIYATEKPPYAIGEAHGDFFNVGALLATRDGRRLGNGIVVAIDEEPAVGQVVKILTDFGNRLTLTESEAQESFYNPLWITNVKEWLETTIDLGKTELLDNNGEITF